MSPDLNFKVIGVAQNGLEEVVFYLKEEDIWVSRFIYQF
jgi:hypothetical protein